MQVNEGKTDRIIRAVVGVVLAVLGFVASGALSIILWIAGAIALITAATGFCGLYPLLGINTCSTKKK